MTIKDSKYFNLIRLLRNEYRSTDELINLQNLALKKLIKHSYNTVKFYKKIFDDCRLKPDDIQSLEDINKIPVIDKDLLKQFSYEELISSKYKRKELLTIKTSGSSGNPYYFYIDKAYDQYRKAQFLRPYITNKRRIFDKSVWFTGNMDTKKRWFHRYKLLSNFKTDPGMDVNDQIKIIKKIRPEVIMGYGSVINLLAIKITENKISIPLPRLIFSDSEILLPHMRENIEAAFNRKVIDIYGTYETDNIAYECSSHSGYHMAIDSVIFEFLKEGKPVNADTDGEIVVTVLNNFAMPFIRYNLHDSGSFTGNICSCGRSFPLMKRIKGRSNDYMLSGKGEKISFFGVLTAFKTIAKKINEYQVIQEDINLFNVLVAPGKSFDKETERFITSSIKKEFPEADINIKLVRKIERDRSGKFKAFKSNIRKING